MSAAFIHIAKVLEVLDLKRQHAAKQLATLEFQDRNIAMQLLSLSTPYDMPALGDDAAVNFHIAARKWQGWRDMEKQRLQIERAALAENIQVQKNELQRLYVQINNIEKELSTAKKKLTQSQNNARAAQRLESCSHKVGIVL